MLQGGLHLQDQERQPGECVLGRNQRAPSWRRKATTDRRRGKAGLARQEGGPTEREPGPDQ